MSGRRLNSYERYLLKIAEALGFEAAGYTGRSRNHLKLRHRETGTVTTISSTPKGEMIARRNAEQQLRRIARGETR